MNQSYILNVCFENVETIFRLSIQTGILGVTL
jgi:hypothetical protein